MKCGDLIQVDYDAPFWKGFSFNFQPDWRAQKYELTIFLGRELGFIWALTQHGKALMLKENCHEIAW